MKHQINFRPSLLLAAAFGAALLVRGVSASLFEPQARAQEKPVPGPDVAAAAPRDMDLQTLNNRLPDQSHAMQDAGYHFENLWYAGDQQNWPLASYYLRKTQSYLELAVQIKPVRKTRAGDVNLKGILDAVNNGMLAQVDQAITNKDTASFRAAYRQTIAGCNACHTACEKSYIRLQIPNAPSTSIITFNPPPPVGK
jgi:hypothetical protein